MTKTEKAIAAKEERIKKFRREIMELQEEYLRLREEQEKAGEKVRDRWS